MKRIKVQFIHKRVFRQSYGIRHQKECNSLASEQKSSPRLWRQVEQSGKKNKIKKKRNTDICKTENNSLGSQQQYFFMEKLYIDCITVQFTANTHGLK